MIKIKGFFRNFRNVGIVLLSIILICSITGLASYYKYTQESGTNFYVSEVDKSDALEDTNELRQIVDDLGNLLGHTKRDGSYPHTQQMVQVAVVYQYLMIIH